eukprot:GHVO01029234.1.p2 GENE.GHVO01029234.1~~GHVO01029234.1.p2  ORF type:complete len:612 (-),score=101.56 GHVO01029234.1:4052-5626(-)
MKERTILERILAFNDDVFFLLLLPPIIFESGFGLSDKRGHYFFKNFGAILWLAFFATLLSFTIIGSCMFFLGVLGVSNDLTLREAFAFGSLISSTDPVSVLGLFRDLKADSTIFALVSGESLLNDAVSIVLYRAIANQHVTNVWMSLATFASTFFFSFSIGIGTGLVSALIYKYMSFNKEENQTLEIGIMLLFAWLSYLISDGASQSGIVSILFCGITMAKYTYPNLSAMAKDSSKSMFGSLALLAEAVVFVFLGLAPFSFSNTQKNATLGLFISTLVVVSAARVISVYVTCMIINWFRSPASKISPNFQHTLVLCGIRGAIALALALRAHHDFGGVNGSALLSATLFYSLFTILILGISLVWFFDKLDVFLINDESPTGAHLAYSYSPVKGAVGNREFEKIDDARSVRIEILRVRRRLSISRGRCGCLKNGILRIDDFMKRVFTHRADEGSERPTTDAEPVVTSSAGRYLTGEEERNEGIQLKAFDSADSVTEGRSSEPVSVFQADMGERKSVASLFEDEFSD